MSLYVRNDGDKKVRLLWPSGGVILAPGARTIVRIPANETVTAVEEGPGAPALPFTSEEG